MIPRYAPADVAELFTDERRFDTMLEVELLARRGAGRTRASCPRPTPRRCARAGPASTPAFVAAVSRARGGHAPRHRGLRRRRPGADRQPRGRLGPLRADDHRRRRHRAVLRRWPQAMDLVGRRGRRAARRADAARGRVDRLADDRPDARRASPSPRPSARSSRSSPSRPTATSSGRGAPARASRSASSRARSGTYSNIDPAVEAYVCGRLGLDPGPGDPGGRARPPRRGALRLRRRWARRSSRSPSRSATSLAARSPRPRSPSPRARRARRRCPTSATRCARERLCGLARVLRGYLSAGLEDVALWHERDISHSSVERVVLPDALAPDRLHAARGDARSPTGWWCTASAPWRT